MNNAQSVYEQYWLLLKRNRGKWIELTVPDEYRLRVLKALSKRRLIECEKCGKLYPRFDIKPALHQTTQKLIPDIILIRLPLNPLDTI